MNTGRLATTGLLLLALALPLAAADSFSVRVKPVSADIFPFEVATYNLTIFNNNPQNASFFQLSGRGGRWLILDEPKLETVEILPGDSSDFLISVTPKLGVGIGPFGIPVKVKDLTTGEYEEFNLPINIKEVDLQTYRPSVALGTSVPREIDPRKAFSVEVLLRNRNPLDIGNLGIRIRGGTARAYYIGIESAMPAIPGFAPPLVGSSRTSATGLLRWRATSLSTSVWLRERACEAQSLCKWAQVNYILNRCLAFLECDSRHRLAMPEFFQ